MKLTSIERKLATLEAEVHALSSRRKPTLQAVIDYRDPAARSLEQAQALALAEHVAAHPEDAEMTVAEFGWSVWRVVESPPRCDRCGQRGTAANPLNSLDCPDRPAGVRLCARCQEPSSEAL
jgi:hypothetical protein